MKRKLAIKNTLPTYKKRVICSIETVKNLFKEVENEGFSAYSITFAYDGKLYYAFYGIDNEKKQYLITDNVEDNTSVTSDSFESALSNFEFAHEITVLQEFQDIDSNIASMGLVPSNDGIVEARVEDNFILKPYIVDSKDQRFNYNMSDELIKKYSDMQVTINKENKKVIIFLVCCVLFIIIFISLIAIFQK